MKLEDLGWSPEFAEAFDADAHPLQIPARVVRIDGVQATVWTQSGEVRVEVARRFHRAHESLGVGDWVAIDPAGGGLGCVARLLPRRTLLARRAAGRQVKRQLLAANVDVVLIVSSMDNDFSERRLERYLTVVVDGGARPVIVLTKAGLTEDPETYVEQARRIAPGVDIHAVDVVAGIRPDAVSAHLAPGLTAVLVGSSGVGKSTLLNHLCGGTRMATRAVRTSDGTGQHTTSHREMFMLPQGGILIDTPGLRELALWADGAALARAFADVHEVSTRCHFRDCRHAQEPGCAIRDAVADGVLDAARVEGYLALRDEIDRTEAQAPAHERRQQDRKQGKLYREIQRHKRGRR